MSWRKLSIGHPDASEELLFVDRIIENEIANKEIYDVYFGSKFNYKFKDKTKSYGNVMSVYASDEQIDKLFELKEKTNIQISLTMNDLNIPPELYLNKNVIDEFIQWLDSFYKRGLRSCTISSTHLMKLGILQTKFPDMVWKNTVNHLVKDSQMVMDYIYLGYDIIQADRSLNRNINELRRMREAVDNFNSKRPSNRKKVLLSLLVTENCLSNCPYKREHDDCEIDYFAYSIDRISCNNWRPLLSPRTGVNAFWFDYDTFKEFDDLVDIFKTSGRLNMAKQKSTPYKFMTSSSLIGQSDYNKSIVSDSFIDLVKSVPVLNIAFRPTEEIDITTPEEFKSTLINKFTGIEHLNKTLKNCKSICWKCHECDVVFDTIKLDSLIQI